MIMLQYLFTYKSLITVSVISFLQQQFNEKETQHLEH